MKSRRPSVMISRFNFCESIDASNELHRFFIVQGAVLCVVDVTTDICYVLGSHSARGWRL